MYSSTTVFNVCSIRTCIRIPPLPPSPSYLPHFRRLHVESHLQSVSRYLRKYIHILIHCTSTIYNDPRGASWARTLFLDLPRLAQPNVQVAQHHQDSRFHIWHDAHGDHSLASLVSFMAAASATNEQKRKARATACADHEHESTVRDSGRWLASLVLDGPSKRGRMALAALMPPSVAQLSPTEQ